MMALNQPNLGQIAENASALVQTGFADVVDGLLTETKAGVSAHSREEVKASLLRLYQEYKSNGAVSYGGNEADINKYNHREVARKFASILDSLDSIIR